MNESRKRTRLAIEQRQCTRRRLHCRKVCTHIVVAEFSKQGNLSQDALGVDQIVESSRDLFDGNLLPVLGVERGYHHAISTVPYWLDQLVLCVNLHNSGPVRSDAHV